MTAFVHPRLSIREEIDALTEAGKPARRPRASKPRGPIPSEAQVQRAIIDALRLRRVYCAHVPNAGLRSVTSGRRLKGEGMRKGFPDLVCYGAEGRHALLEVKRPGYAPSDVGLEQRNVHETLRALGATVEIVTSADEAIAVLTAAGWF